SRCNSWRLGTEASLPLAGAQVSTPAFDELQTSAPARRALWQQICAHEHDFYPQHG
ncbi:DNA polymerase III subunit psi, partial [Mycobacterium tuberculosis]|nr:DNA polymerase III subunit psi [Mycobacterium tuberculosis]